MSTKKIQILGGFPQADFNQKDETKSDYIKNKPDIDALQPKIDETLTTTDKTIVGAINEVNDAVGTLMGSKGLAFTSNGDGTCYVSGIGDCTDTDVVIPSTSPEGDSVTSIGNSAFTYCTSLTSVVIPDSVTSIGEWAFERCDSLTSIVIPDSVTSISVGVFNGCCNLISVVIGDSVTSIGDYAFCGCESLTFIVIPDSVTSIGVFAFEGCFSLTSVVVPDSATKIVEDAFSGCTSLSDVYYTGSEEEWININIDYLTNATIHYNYADNFIAVDDKLVEIRGSINELNEKIDKTYSKGLSYTEPVNGTCYVNGIGTCTDKDIIIPEYTEDGSIVIGIAAEAFCIKDPVEENVFIDNTTITSVTMPDTITEIGNFAFTSCTAIKNIKLSDNLQSIGDGAFAGLTSLERLVIPASVTEMGSRVISGSNVPDFMICLEASGVPETWGDSWLVAPVPIIGGYIEDFADITQKLQDVDSKTADKLGNITLAKSNTKNAIPLSIGIMYDNTYETNLGSGAVTNCIPIVAGENVTFEATANEQDIPIVKINATDGVDKIGIIDTWCAGEVQSLDDTDGISWEEQFALKDIDETETFSTGLIYHRIPLVAGDNVTFSNEGDVVKINASGLPTCTTDNNGQFLCVVDGVATWTTIPDGDEVAY